MVTTTRSQRTVSPIPGTEDLLNLQGQSVAEKVAGSGDLGNFLDFDIANAAAPDASLSDDTFDFSKGFNADFLQELQNQTNASFQGQGLNAGEQGLIDTTFDAQRLRGEQDLFRFADELAGRGNLQLSDSPVADPALRAFSDFQSNIGGAQAAAELGQINTNRGRLDSARGFQENLQQQGFLNRNTHQSFADNIKNRAIQNRISLLGQAVPGMSLTNSLLGLSSSNTDQTLNGPGVGTLESIGNFLPALGAVFNSPSGGGSSAIENFGGLLNSGFQGLFGDDGLFS